MLLKFDFCNVKGEDQRIGPFDPNVSLQANVSKISLLSDFYREILKIANFSSYNGIYSENERRRLKKDCPLNMDTDTDTLNV